MFHRKRSVATPRAWPIILLIFLVLGLILYGFIGRGLLQENPFAINNQKHTGLNKVNKMIPRIPKDTGSIDTSREVKILIDHFNFKYDSPLPKNNKISLYIDGEEKFKALFNDINQAKETINVEYYSLMNDDLGNRFLSLLIRKACEGMKIRLIYDPWKSPGVSKAWLKSLADLGGEVAVLITLQNTIKKYRIDYHFYRKIVTVDGRISWTDGFNAGDQYVSKSKKFGYWRNTHLRIVGSASLLSQECSVMDWNASVTNKNETISFNGKLFPKIEENKLTEDDVVMQVVSDGSNISTPYLCNGMIRMTMMARKTLRTQTPYLVPDDPMIATWVIVAYSGADVRIMTPSMSDHPFIYRATQWYANYLLHEGTKIYVYNDGFIHAKTVMAGERFSAVGSINQNFRSYNLSFETNAIFYDKNITWELSQIFEKDLTNCTELTLDITNNWPRYSRFKQASSRLFSPIL